MIDSLLERALGEADIRLTERPNVALKGKRESIALYSPQSAAGMGGRVEP